MDKFQFHAPTQIIFGKETQKRVGNLCKQYGAHKVLVHYGGHSAEKSGLLTAVCQNLQEAGLEYVLLGGVVPNPRLSKVLEGVQLCKEQAVDFILAIGGGSVIDSAKGIAYGVANPGELWDYYSGKLSIQDALPLGAVLTIAAAGSEMSNCSVITNEEGWLKRGLSTPFGYCRFAIMNPELTYTLPPYQTASGCVDIMLHTLERYFTAPAVEQLAIIDRIAESLLRDVMRNALILKNDPHNYAARAEIMWCGTLSHNDTSGDRSYGDWSCHQLEHELSGKWDIAHGAGLAAVWGSWARYVYQENIPRFAQLAVNVLNVPNNFQDQQAVALEGIKALESFFKHIDMPTSIGQLGIELSEADIQELAYKCSFMGERTIGQFKKLKQQDMENIYRLAK